METNCKYCEQEIPISKGNTNYHLIEPTLAVRCMRESVQHREILEQMSEQQQITMQDIDRIVLEERSSLENATMEVLEARCTELQEAFDTL